MSRRRSRISQVLRRDPFADPEFVIRRVYAYVAYRIGAGAAAEEVTRDVLTRALESKAAEQHTGVWLIDTARRELDERFGPPERDRGFVALHLVGLDAAQIAELLRYRPEAASVALERALSRLGGEQEPVWAEPAPEFVERLTKEIRAARQPVSRRRRRALGLAISALALLAAVPAFGALVAGDKSDEGRQVEQPSAPSTTARKGRPQPPRPSTTTQEDRARQAPSAAQEQRAECDHLAKRLDALPARHAQAQSRLIRRLNREKQAFSTTARRRLEREPGSRRLAAEISRQLLALEARHSRELEASNERQSRELARHEARLKRCRG